MVGTNQSSAVGENLLEEGDGLAQHSRRVVGTREVASGPQGLGVLAPENPLAAGQGLLEEGNGLFQVSECLVHVRQVVPGGQRARIIGAEIAFALSQGALVVRNVPWAAHDY